MSNPPHRPARGPQVARTTIRCASTWSMIPARAGLDRGASCSMATLLSIPVAHERRIRLQKRHGP